MNDLLNIPSAAGRQTPQEFIDDLPLPYLEVDRNGFITRANRATYALHSHAHGSLIGRMAWEAMASDEMMASFAAFCSLLESGEVPSVVRRNIFVSSGQFRTFELHRSLVLDEAGKPNGMRMIGIDVTESAKALEEARSTALWLQSVGASIPEPVLVTDAMGLIRSVNPAAEAFFGWPPNTVCGKLVEQVLPLALDAPLPNPPIDFNRALEAPQRIRLTLLEGQSQPVLVELASSPIADAQTGHLAGVVWLLHKL
jgi:PAS domain S-box-containing protein